MRQCTKCENEMSEGFIFDGSDSYCSEECLSDVATPQEWNQLHKEEPDYFYWTQWEEEEEVEDIDDFCPDLNEWGEIDTGRNPGGDYLDTDFT